jgi:hypothetical protein
MVGIPSLAEGVLFSLGSSLAIYSTHGFCQL